MSGVTPPPGGGGGELPGVPNGSKKVRWRGAPTASKEALDPGPAIEGHGLLSPAAARGHLTSPTPVRPAKISPSRRPGFVLHPFRWLSSSYVHSDVKKIFSNFISVSYLFHFRYFLQIFFLVGLTPSPQKNPTPNRLFCQYGGEEQPPGRCQVEITMILKDHRVLILWPPSGFLNHCPTRWPFGPLSGQKVIPYPPLVDPLIDPSGSPLTHGWKVSFGGQLLGPKVSTV